jgi:hypothetical protein
LAKGEPDAQPTEKRAADPSGGVGIRRWFLNRFHPPSPCKMYAVNGPELMFVDCNRTPPIGPRNVMTGPAPPTSRLAELKCCPIPELPKLNHWACDDPIPDRWMSCKQNCTVASRLPVVDGIVSPTVTGRPPVQFNATAALVVVEAEVREIVEIGISEHPIQSIDK